MRPAAAHRLPLAVLALALSAGAGGSGCANQTTFHTTPLGAKVYVNGALCGESPCVHHSRYGFPDRIRLQLHKPGYEPAEFFLDTEPPLASYLLFGFGSYLFHTYPEDYRFTLKPAPVPPAPPSGVPPASPPSALSAPSMGAPPDPPPSTETAAPLEP